MKQKLQKIYGNIQPYLLQGSDYIITIIATGIHAALIFAYGIFVRHYIEPLEYGFYTTANIVLTYMNYLQFGVLNSYNRDFPKVVGESNESKAQKLKNITVTYILFVYLVVGVIVSIGAILYSFFVSSNSKIALGVVLICFIALISNTVSIFTVEYKSYGRFKYAAIVTIVSTLVQVILGGFFVYRIGYYGIYIALILNSVSSIIMMKKSIKKIKFTFDKCYLFQQIKTGFPLLINSLIWTLIMTSDQFIILSFRDSEQLGLYSVAQTVFSVMILIPQTVSQVMYIKLSNLYGATNDRNILLSTTQKYTTLLMIVNCMACMFVYSVIPEFVNIFMPAYASGANAARILCVGVTIYGSTMAFGNLFSILKENKRIVKASVILCVANIILSCGCVFAFGFKLEFVALGTALSYTIYGCILLKNTQQLYGLRQIKTAVILFVPIVFTTIITFFTNRWISNIIIRLAVIVFVVVISVAVFILFKRRTKSEN